MRDRRFREDENELPYLVWETREDNRRNGNAGSIPLKVEFKDVPFSEFRSCARRLLLPSDHIDNIIRSIEVKARNCTFTLRQNDDDIRITLNIENEYVKTEINLSYDLNSCKVEYRWRYTYHDDLKSMQWFIDAVRQVEKEKGYRYVFCYDGQEFEYMNGKILIKDDYTSKVMFENDGDLDHYGYKVDFANKKLERYHVYAFHEYFLYFC